MAFGYLNHIPKIESDIALHLVYLSARLFQPINLFFFLKFNLYCIFSVIRLVPLYLPLPSNHHTVVHAHESFFLFAQLLYSLLSPLNLSSCSPSMSLSIFLVSSVCSLDSTGEWNHMVFVFLWLAYFT